MRDYLWVIALLPLTGCREAKVEHVYKDVKVVMTSGEEIIHEDSVYEVKTVGAGIFVSGREELRIKENTRYAVIKNGRVYKTVSAFLGISDPTCVYKDWSQVTYIEKKKKE